MLLSQEPFAQLFQDLYEHVFYNLPDSPFRQALDLKASWNNVFHRANLPKPSDMLDTTIKEPSIDQGGSGPRTQELIPFVTSGFRHAECVAMVVMGVSELYWRLMLIDD